MVRFENVFMRYDGGPVILRDVSFDLQPGSFHFLTGGSGAGKSDLALRLIDDADTPAKWYLKLKREFARCRAEGLGLRGSRAPWSRAEPAGPAGLPLRTSAVTPGARSLWS